MRFLTNPFYVAGAIIVVAIASPGINWVGGLGLLFIWLLIWFFGFASKLPDGQTQSKGTQTVSRGGSNAASDASTRDKKVDIRGMYYHSIPEQLAKEHRFKLVREPGNPHDSNAIAVTFGRRLLGHVPREVAATYAPRMDRSNRTEIIVEGRLTSDQDGWVLLPGDLQDAGPYLPPPPPPPAMLGHPIEPWGRAKLRTEFVGSEAFDHNLDAICATRGINRGWDTSSMNDVDGAVALVPGSKTAVGIYVDGLQVGSLRAEDARSYRPGLRDLARRGQVLSARVSLWLGSHQRYTHVWLPEPHMVAAPGPMPDGAYVLLPPGSTIQVTGEERYLSDVSALLEGEPERPVVAELYSLVKATARSEKTVVGVRVDGQEVGELTAASSAHFLPLLEACDEEGVAVICRGLVKGNLIKADVVLNAAKAGDLTNDWIADHVYGSQAAESDSVSASGPELPLGPGINPWESESP